MADSALHDELQAMRDSGADRFDALRFRYIEALLSRAEQKPAAVARQLRERAAERLQAYRRDSQQSSETPCCPVVAAAPGPLADLLARLAPPQPRDGCLQTSLMAQEQALFETAPEQQAEAPASLRAAQHFRQSRRRLRAETLLAKTLADKPEDPGPLNPQMLATRLMAGMQQRSPQYFQTMVAYLESLFWLERAAGGKRDGGARATGQRRVKKPNA